MSLDMWHLFGILALALVVGAVVSAGYLAKHADDTRVGEHGAPGHGHH